MKAEPRLFTPTGFWIAAMVAAIALGFFVVGILGQFGCGKRSAGLLCPIGQKKVIDDNGLEGCESTSTILDELKRCHDDISPPLALIEAVRVCCATFSEPELDLICQRDKKTPVDNFNECVEALAPIEGAINAAVNCCMVWDFDPEVQTRCK